MERVDRRILPATFHGAFTNTFASWIGQDFLSYLFLPPLTISVEDIRLVFARFPGLAMTPSP